MTTPSIPTAMTLIAVIEACRIPLSMDLYRHLAARTNVTVSRVMERVARIELAPTAWKAEVLPLNYTRDFSNPLVHRVFRASLRLSSPAFTDAFFPHPAHRRELSSGGSRVGYTAIPSRLNLPWPYQPQRFSRLFLNLLFSTYYSRPTVRSSILDAVSRPEATS